MAQLLVDIQNQTGLYSFKKGYNKFSMDERWIAKYEKDRQEKLAQLERQAISAQEDASVHKWVALGAAYVTALMAGAAEYTYHKWGIRQDIESAIGGFTLSITVLETSLMRKNKHLAAEAWQEIERFSIEEGPEQLMTRDT
jgi:hypothetical protein